VYNYKKNPDIRLSLFQRSQTVTMTTMMMISMISRRCDNFRRIGTGRPPDVAPVVLGCFGQICTAHAHKHLFSSFW